MRKFNRPTSGEEWEDLAGNILKAQLKLSGMNYVHLARALGKLGVKTDNRNISLKIWRGKFSATFFLQALIAAKVDYLQLPEFHADED